MTSCAVPTPGSRPLRSALDRARALGKRLSVAAAAVAPGEAANGLEGRRWLGIPLVDAARPARPLFADLAAALGVRAPTRLPAALPSWLADADSTRRSREVRHGDVCNDRSRFAPLNEVSDSPTRRPGRPDLPSPTADDERSRAPTAPELDPTLRPAFEPREPPCPRSPIDRTRACDGRPRPPRNERTSRALEDRALPRFRPVEEPRASPDLPRP